MPSPVPQAKQKREGTGSSEGTRVPSKNVLRSLYADDEADPFSQIMMSDSEDLRKTSLSSSHIDKKKAGYSVEQCPQNLIIATKSTTSSDQLPREE